MATLMRPLDAFVMLTILITDSSCDVWGMELGGQALLVTRRRPFLAAPSGAAGVAQLNTMRKAGPEVSPEGR